MWPDTMIVDELWDMKGNWATWLGLLAAMTVALLLFGRAQGYRLARGHSLTLLRAFP